MPTTLDDLRRWLAEGKRQKATHMIVFTDTYDWDDFPVYVKPGEDARTVAKAKTEQPHSMLRVTEVYSYAKDLDEQLATHRVQNWD